MIHRMAKLQESKTRSPSIRMLPSSSSSRVTVYPSRLGLLLARCGAGAPRHRLDSWHGLAVRDSVDVEQGSKYLSTRAHGKMAPSPSSFIVNLCRLLHHHYRHPVTRPQRRPHHHEVGGNMPCHATVARQPRALSRFASQEHVIPRQKTSSAISPACLPT